MADPVPDADPITEGVRRDEPVLTNVFGLKDILSDAFAAFKAHFGLVLGCFVVFSLIQLVCGKLAVFILFISPHMITGFSLVLIKVLRGGEPPAFSDLFKGFSYYMPVLAAGLLVGLFLVLGLCLIIPGIFLGLMWSQTFFLLADDILAVEAGRKDKATLAGWGAMQRSAALMVGQKLRFLGYTVVLAVIGLSGVLAVGIGVFITMPFAWLSGAAFYGRLTKPAS